MKSHGGRPGFFDAAFLLTRYQREFTMLELPVLVRRVVMPLVCVVGTMVGKYAKYRQAPAPVQR